MERRRLLAKRRNYAIDYAITRVTLRGRRDVPRDEPEPGGLSHRIAAIGDVELVQQTRNMSFNGPPTEEQVLGHLRIGSALTKQRENLVFPRRQNLGCARTGLTRGEYCQRSK